MDILITPGARALLNSHIDDPAVLTLIGRAMNYEKEFKYRQDMALAKKYPDLRPVTYLHNNKLGLRHMVAEEQVMLFIPPEDSRNLHEGFLNKELATCTQLMIA